MRQKWLSVLLCLSMLVMCMCGCAKKETPQIDDADIIELTIYAQYADDDTRVPYDYAVEQLAIAYPNVRLKLVIQSKDDGSTLFSLAQSGQLPDIFQSNSAIVSRLRETNQVMELDAVAESSGYLDKLIESNRELAYSEDGHIYTFPYAGNEYLLIYYNADLFEEYELEVPHTYDELLHCIEVFNENDIVPLELMTEGWVYTAMYDVIATRYNSAGIEALDDGTALITDEAYVNAAETLETLVDAGIFQDNVGNVSYDEATQAFYSGEAAMLINGQWFITDATEQMGDSVDWMFYPSYDEESYEAQKFVFSGGGSTSGFSVNPDSENAELAAEVAEFITEKYCEAKVLYRGTPLVAINTGLEPENEFPPMMDKLYATIPMMTSTTQFAWGLSNTIFYDAITDNSIGLVSGEYTAERFIQEVSDDMDLTGSPDEASSDEETPPE